MAKIDSKNIPWKDLDKKIIPLVRFLNKRGIRTLQSCEGHPRETLPLDAKHPWVDIAQESFTANLDFINKVVNYSVYGKYWGACGRIVKIFAPPTDVCKFPDMYRIVFYNMYEVKRFMRRWRKLSNG